MNQHEKASGKPELPPWTEITDVRDPAYGHATHEAQDNGGDRPVGLHSIWHDPQNPRWLGKSPELPIETHKSWCQSVREIEYAPELCDCMSVEPFSAHENGEHCNQCFNAGYDSGKISTKADAEALAEALREAIEQTRFIFGQSQGDNYNLGKLQRGMSNALAKWEEAQ